MNKYEERVKQRAEEMLLLAESGLETCKHSIGGRRYALRLIEERIDKYTPLARLSVAREAGAAKQALLDNNHDRPSVYMEDYLVRNGLIPPQTQTT